VKVERSSSQAAKGFPLPFLIGIAIFSTLPAASNEASSFTSLRSFAEWFLLKSATLVLIVLEFQLYARTVNAIVSIRRRIFLVAFLGFITGLTSGLLIHYGANYFGLTSSLSLRTRALTTGIYACGWITATYWAGNNYSRLSQQRKDLLAARLELSQSTYSQSLYLEGIRAQYLEKLVNQASESTHDFLGNLEAGIDEYTSPEEILRLINVQLDRLDTLTDFIKKTEANSRARSTHQRLVNWRWNIADFIDFIKVSFKQAVVPPWIFALLISTSVFFALSHANQNHHFTIFTFALPFCIYGVQVGIARMRTDLNSLRLNFVSALLQPLVVIYLLSFQRQHIIQNSGYSFALKYILATILVVVITLLFHTNRALILDVESLINVETIAIANGRIQDLTNREELTRINQLWVQHIHGTVKSKLFAAIVLIQKSEKGDSVESYTESLQQARELLASTSEPPGSKSSNTFEEIVSRINRWEGLVKIIFTYKEERIQELVRDHDVVADLVEEAISNAVRHGQCEVIHIDVNEDTSGGLRIEISDDGIGPTKSARGIGSGLFESATSGNWKLIRDKTAARTLLTLNLTP